jgi:hypothetical protein
MKVGDCRVGDLVRLTRHGWESIVGVVIERKPRQMQARVLWGNTGKIGICYAHQLEVINENR